MKPSIRILIAGVVIEALLAGLAWWLLRAMERGDLTPAGDPAEAAGTILSVIGAAMGVVVALVLTIFVVQRRAGR